MARRHRHPPSKKPADSRLHQLQLGITANPGALLPIANAGSAPLVNLKRTTLFVNYTLSSIRNNTDGAFSLAPLGNIDSDWGPANGVVVLRNTAVAGTRKVETGINFSF
jgi:hypothetical protein